LVGLNFSLFYFLNGRISWWNPFKILSVIKFGIGMKCLLVAVCLLYATGCAAGKVYVNRTNDPYISCKAIEKELLLTQKRIHVLEDADHTFQNIRDAFLSFAQLAFSPIKVLNGLLTISDSHIADIAEVEALTERHDRMITISNQKNCGYKYAMIQRDTTPDFPKN